MPSSAAAAAATAPTPTKKTIFYLKYRAPKLLWYPCVLLMWILAHLTVIPGAVLHPPMFPITKVVPYILQPELGGSYINGLMRQRETSPVGAFLYKFSTNYYEVALPFFLDVGMFLFRSHKVLVLIFCAALCAHGYECYLVVLQMQTINDWALDDDDDDDSASEFDDIDDNSEKNAPITSGVTAMATHMSFLLMVKEEVDTILAVCANTWSRGQQKQAESDVVAGTRQQQQQQQNRRGGCQQQHQHQHQHHSNSTLRNRHQHQQQRQKQQKQQQEQEQKQQAKALQKYDSENSNFEIIVPWYIYAAYLLTTFLGGFTQLQVLDDEIMNTYDLVDELDDEDD